MQPSPTTDACTRLNTAQSPNCCFPALDPHPFLWLGMRPGANAPAVGHHATTWRPRHGDGPSSEWPRISTQPSLTSQIHGKCPAAQGELQLVCSSQLKPQQTELFLAHAGVVPHPICEDIAHFLVLDLTVQNPQRAHFFRVSGRHDCRTAFV